jgi:hypothetical protein
MARPRKYADKAEGYEAQNRNRKRQRSEHPVEFVAVDGEGTGSGRDHRYILLGVGDQQCENESGLKFTEIASFLYSQFLLTPKVAFVGFFLGYDFTQWFKTLPEERARRLLTDRGIASRARKSHPQLGPFPVEYEGWEFDILGFKRFKLRETGAKSWMFVNDAGPFFQTSLIKAIDPKGWSDPVVTEEEYATILEGKSKRDSARLDDNMRRYNRLENVTLARLMDRLNTGFVAADVRLKRNQWFGPGQAAQAWLSGTTVPSSDDLSGMPNLARERGRLSYYGGWFEIFAHGHIPNQSYEYDINSAYPYIAASLPCLLHGTWSNGSGIPGDLGPDAIRLVHATVTSTDKHLGAMLHRVPDGSIRRPSYTRGWYWQAEIDAAIRCGAITSIEYGEWSEYTPCDCEPPLRGLIELYEQRLSVGKNTPHGKSLKLTYNSVYGKLAQSIGNPKYGNALYASLITSGCRTMILAAIASHPNGTNALLMVATDGVYFTHPHPTLKISERIGEWSEENHDGLTLFKPGVYWDDAARERIRNGDNPNFRARGINATEFGKRIAEIDSAFRQWGDTYPAERDPLVSRDGGFPRIRFTSGFSLITCQQALQRNKWPLAGTLGHEAERDGCQGCDGNHLIQDSEPIGKRHSGWYEDGIYWSRPYKDGGKGEVESTPYDKRFGMPDDPDVYGYNQDGYVLDTWKGLLQ